MARSDFDRVGGAEGLERIIEAFVDRVVDDFIIGFFFVGKDLERIKTREFEHASSHLGGPHSYGGRPLDRVHRPLRINRGHFRRRLALMHKTLREQGVDEDIIERWIAHDEALVDEILDRDVDCVD